MTFSTIRDAVYSRLQSDHGNHGVRFIDYERIMPTLDPSCLIAREADHQMYAIAGGTEILLRAASVLPAQMAAVSTLMGANLRVRDWIWDSLTQMDWMLPLRCSRMDIFNLSLRFQAV